MLRENLQNALKNAMKEKNMPEVSAVRMIIAGMKEKDVDARGKGRPEADDSELLAMMQTMIKQRMESIKMYNDGNRADLAAKEQAEISVIERFMPQQLSADETLAVIKKAISETEAASMKDMGKVMAVLKAKYAGQIDFGSASGLIKTLLS